jgi:prepilin-type N-terminal cleavage/methylation domain-containing protein
MEKLNNISNLRPVLGTKQLIQKPGLVKQKAFTLVELIVVITILAILATIGFVSFSGYLAGSRDVNRISQLKSMNDALILYSTKKDLPIPDGKVNVNAS